MRTTANIDDDVLAAARQYADARGISLGEALSQLARSALSERPSSTTRNGVVLLPARSGGRQATLDDVNALRDETP
jgi:hypothetical protein